MVKEDDLDEKTKHTKYGVSRIFGDDHHEGLARFTVDVIIQLKIIQLKYQA